MRRLLIINQRLVIVLFAMSFLKCQRQTANPMKKSERKYIGRAALPLPILSLQTKDEINHEVPKMNLIKTIKPPIRENFKKMLDILNKPEKKNQCIPLNFYNKQNQSKQLLRKRMKTNLEFYRPQIDHLLLRTQIVNAVKKIEINIKPKSEEDETLSQSKLSAPNLQRTIRFRKKSRLVFQAKPNRFMKWESFCTSVSFQNKYSQNLPKFQMKKKLNPRSYLKKRSQSTFNHVSCAQVINGWEEGLVRYATDYDRVDFSDIYD